MTTPTNAIFDLLEADLPITDIADGIAVAWRRGWHPMDLARLIGTGRGPTLRVVADAIALDRQSWHPNCAPLWIHQADELGADTVWWDQQRPYWPQVADHIGASPNDLRIAATHLEVIGGHLPQQPVLEAPPTKPGAAAHAVDDTVLAKVRGLLAKAESTTFDHEAEALAAKAQELISRHSIDLALIGGDVDIPGGRRIYIDPPYAKPKFVLLSAIATANTCRCVWNDGTKTATVFGHQTDMHLTEMLFTSLLLQGTGAVVDAGTKGDGWGGNATKSWRHAFWHGFAHRIGQRLDEAVHRARTDHTQKTGDDLLPVLAGRSAAVDRALEDAFPRLGTMRTSVSNGAGLHAGRRFADRAELDASRTVQPKSTRELPA